MARKPPHHAKALSTWSAKTEYTCAVLCSEAMTSLLYSATLACRLAYTSCAWAYSCCHALTHAAAVTPEQLTPAASSADTRAAGGVMSKLGTLTPGVRSEKVWLVPK
eukprot:2801407-Prymnesium_polylepis.1